MTEDYKTNLLKYITGKLQNKEGKEVAIFQQPTHDVSTIFEELRSLKNAFIDDILQSKNQDNSNSSYNLIYGHYTQMNDIDTQTFFMVVDGKGKFLQLITNLSNGMLIPYCRTLTTLEDGRFAGIFDSTSQNYKYQFSILNNVCLRLQEIDDFTAEFRATVFIPTSTQLNNCEDIQAIYKNPIESKYLIGGRLNVNVGGLTIKMPVITEFVYIVGQEQKWNDYSDSNYASRGFETDCSISSIFGLWQGDDVTIQAIVYYPLNPSIIGYVEKFAKGSYACRKYELPISGSAVSHFSSKIIGVQNAYFGFNVLDVQNGLSSNLYYISPETEEFEINSILEYHGSKVGTLWNSMYFNLGLSNNEIFVIYSYNEGTKVDYYAGLVQGDNISFIALSTAEEVVTNKLFIVNNQFNLYNVHFIANDNLTTTRLIYNRNNYNGESYENQKMLLPNSAILYNNGLPIFARNLYNRVVNQNVTTSTIEVPNHYLNNATIESEDLQGLTNLKLVSSSQAINKNIYENLHINFINTLNILDDNGETSELNPLSGQISLNNSINNESSEYGDYNDVKLTAYRIAYQDGTEEYHLIGNDQITIKDNIATYNFGILLPKKASYLFLTGNNTETKLYGCNYIYIDISNLEINKNYMVTQKVEIN